MLLLIGLRCSIYTMNEDSCILYIKRGLYDMLTKSQGLFHFTRMANLPIFFVPQLCPTFISW